MGGTLSPEAVIQFFEQFFEHVFPILIWSFAGLGCLAVLVYLLLLSAGYSPVSDERNLGHIAKSDDSEPVEETQKMSKTWAERKSA